MSILELTKEEIALVEEFIHNEVQLMEKELNEKAIQMLQEGADLSRPLMGVVQIGMEYIKEQIIRGREPR